MTYSITLERGANGTYVAWVDDLPGCAVRAPSRAEVLEKLPGAINEFVAWTGQAAPEAVEIDVVEEVESAIEADEDTEVLISADRAALTEQDWSQLLESLANRGPSWSRCWPGSRTTSSRASVRKANELCGRRSSTSPSSS
jgi:predicted RNase H-like HicB family nuclease